MSREPDPRAPAPRKPKGRQAMTDRGDLLARLTTAVAHAPPATSLTDRLCVAFRDLAGASAAAFTVWYGEPHRITLAATHPSAARLEDLQDVIGEGPGHA